MTHNLWFISYEESYPIYPIMASKTHTRLRTQYEQTISYIEYNLGEMKIRTDWKEIILCVLIVIVFIGIPLSFIFLRLRRHSMKREKTSSTSTEMTRLQYGDYNPGQGIDNTNSAFSMLVDQWPLYWRLISGQIFICYILWKIFASRTSTDLAWSVGNLFGNEESKMFHQSWFNSSNIKRNWERKFWRNNACFLWWDWICLQDAETTE